MITPRDNSDYVTLRLAQATRLDDGDLTVLVEDLCQVFAQPTSCGPGIQIRFNNDPSGHEVEPTGEAQQG